MPGIRKIVEPKKLAGTEDAGREGTRSTEATTEREGRSADGEARRMRKKSRMLNQEL